MALTWIPWNVAVETADEVGEERSPDEVDEMQNPEATVRSPAFRRFDANYLSVTGIAAFSAVLPFVCFRGFLRP